MLWDIDTKLCVYHCHLTQNTLLRLDNGAICWSKVKRHSILLLVVLNDFSAIWTTIILKWLQLLIAAVGLMLASVVLGPVIAACSYILLMFFISSPQTDRILLPFSFLHSSHVYPVFVARKPTHPVRTHVHAHQWHVVVF